MTYNPDIELLMPELKNIASQCDFVLEIGPAQGNGSTVAFQQGLLFNKSKERLHISVDIRDYMEQKPTSAFWKFVLGDSRIFNTVEVVFANSGDRQADLIFIGTHHTYEQLQRELEVWQVMAHDKTVWLFHDTWMMGEYNHMTDAIKEFAAKKNWTYEDISKDSHGLGMMYKKWRPKL